MAKQVEDDDGRYQCAECGGIFTKDRDGWSHEQAVEEAKELFGVDPIGHPDFVLVCDECFKAIDQKFRLHENKPNPINLFDVEGS